MFGFEPDPAYPLAPFHPEAVNGMIGRCRVAGDGIVETAFLPVWSAPPGRPEVAGPDKARAIADYIDGIGVTAGLPPLRRFWADGWVALKA
jgi:poly-gamma-glutamate synthesis protein (capsule biosynthesis protein)